tara:strand:- start:569 stop:826 length:258 start_codon:yes stop_codon:yes gene_type:complete
MKKKPKVMTAHLGFKIISVLIVVLVGIRRLRMLVTTSTKMYKTRDGNLMRLEQFQSLNNGKNLTKSQEKLLGLKKVKSKRKEKYE